MLVSGPYSARVLHLLRGVLLWGPHETPESPWRPHGVPMELPGGFSARHGTPWASKGTVGLGRGHLEGAHGIRWVVPGARLGPKGRPNGALIRSNASFWDVFSGHAFLDAFSSLPWGGQCG